MGQPVVHFEIGSRDTERARRFYAQLFGWDMQSHGPALMIETGSKEGIQGNLYTPDSEPKTYVTVYVQVDNIEASLAAATKLGGKTLAPASEVPGMGHFAWFADLDGNAVGLWKPAANAQGE